MVESEPVSPVLQDLKPRLDDLRAVRGDRQYVDRFIEAGIGVYVGPEAHPDTFQVIDQLLLLEVDRAVERHVLYEVRQAQLILGLENGSSVHHEAEFRPFLRFPVLADVVTEAVRQFANGYVGVDRKRAVWV